MANDYESAFIFGQNIDPGSNQMTKILVMKSEDKLHLEHVKRYRRKTLYLVLAQIVVLLVLVVVLLYML